MTFASESLPGIESEPHLFPLTARHCYLEGLSEQLKDDLVRPALVLGDPHRPNHQNKQLAAGSQAGSSRGASTPPRGLQQPQDPPLTISPTITGPTIPLLTGPPAGSLVGKITAMPPAQLSLLGWTLSPHKGSCPHLTS